jgi:ribosomal protein S18 acetylase RimI-like enzyme
VAEVRAVRPQELAEVAALLGRVFDTEAMVTWTFPPDSDMVTVSERFFGALHGVAEPDGWIWVVGDARVQGMAMWVPPDPDGRYADVLAAIDDEVAELAGVLKSRYDAFWEWVEAHRPPRPHWYLEHVAVDAEARGRGLGRALIEHGLSGADAEGVTSWLVTSKPGNVPMYERFGFAVEAAEDAPEGGPHLWFMARDPR